jgi:hypothetical protein
MQTPKLHGAASIFRQRASRVSPGQQQTRVFAHKIARFLLDRSLHSGRGVTAGFDLTRGDELFAALDGHILATDESQWEVRVAGVHEEGSDLWAQVIISGPRQYAGTFHTDSASAVDLLASVREWLADCESLQPAALSLARI